MKSVLIKISLVCILVCLTFAGATEFAVNVHRHNPYNRAKFRVKWDGRVVPGIIRINGLDRVTKVMSLKSGNEKAGMEIQMPGSTQFTPITLERGRTHDPAFENWANAVWNRNSGGPSQDYKKNITIELLNEAGQVVMSFHVFDCWPVKYSPLTELDAGSSEIAIESLVLQHTGWERDQSVSEPTEPGYTIP